MNFITSTNKSLSELYDELEGLQRRTPFFDADHLMPWNDGLRPTVLDGDRENQMATLHKSLEFKNFLRPMLDLRGRIRQFGTNLKKAHPYFWTNRVPPEGHVEQVMSTTVATAHIGCTNVGPYLWSIALLMTSEYTMMARLIYAITALPKSTVQDSLKICFEENIVDCERFVVFARSLHQPRQEVEGLILSALFAALECAARRYHEHTCM